MPLFLYTKQFTRPLASATQRKTAFWGGIVAVSSVIVVAVFMAFINLASQTLTLDAVALTEAGLVVSMIILLATHALIMGRYFFTDEEISETQKTNRMLAGSEVFCRQTELVLRQNVGMVPADFELAELQQEIATLDALRPRLQRLRTLTDRADDTELALGSDILSASLDGYALTKVIGKGTGLDTLNAAMKTRLARKPRKPADPAA